MIKVDNIGCDNLWYIKVRMAIRMTMMMTREGSLSVRHLSQFLAEHTSERKIANETIGPMLIQFFPIPSYNIIWIQWCVSVCVRLCDCVCVSVR